MCRWIAYTGPSLQLDELLIKPTHSLMTQSRHARESTFSINADGYGVGWYTSSSASPGVYHETRPAWNDENLRSLASHLSSPLFMSHIRAATSVVSRTNCHPFTCDNWMFQHNGAIGGFDEIRHTLDEAIDPRVYAQKRGCTDSETMFGLCLTEGLRDDPPGAIARMIRRVEGAREAAGVEPPFNMTVAISDGTTLWAARYGSAGDGPSLYHTANRAALDQASARAGVIEAASTIVVSEPLDDCGRHWVEVPGGHWLQAVGDEVGVSPLPAG
ncbi:MAG: class II glutamine amidotransferase [Phycisphaerales bacterium]|jgi:glutamine amidotransferase|nr:class II glutamine amidotransferase [Phycisphaerales bacterium]